MRSSHKKKKSMIKNFIIFFLVLILLGAGTVLYSRFIATKGITVKEYNINAPTIPDSFDGLKIAHISDIHYRWNHLHCSEYDTVDQYESVFRCNQDSCRTVFLCCRYCISDLSWQDAKMS